MPSTVYSAADDFERRFVRPRDGRTLIVGSRLYDGREDRRELYDDAVGIDMLGGPGVDRVLNLEDTLPKGLGKFAHIECMSVLEHSRKPWRLAANLQRLMQPEATLHISVPMVWRVHSYPDDYFRVTPAGLRALFDGMGWIKIALAHVELKQNDLVPSVEVDGHPYFARTEVIGFGVRQ